MEIKLTIPDEYKNRRFWLVADQELVASKEPVDDFWEVKDIRCNFCGSCCMDVPPNHLPYGTDDEGKCNMLIKQSTGEWKCDTGHAKPWSCLGTPNKDNAPDCCVTFKRQKV